MFRLSRILCALVSSAAWATLVHGATIAGFNPTFGPAGTQVTVLGSGFLGTTNVQVGGRLADFTVLAQDRLLVIVPAWPVTGAIRVGAPSGGAVSAATFQAPPRIDGFWPERSGAGTLVAIDGANFTGTTNVQFNGSNAVFAVTAPTQISATIPAGASSGPVRVATPAGETLSLEPFVVSGPAPIIDQVVPFVGAPGATVRIEGVNFTGATRVSFNGVPAVFTVVAGTQINATVPAGASTGFVAVTSPQGTGLSAVVFTVTQSPYILGFTPTFGTAGTPVVIEGINFNNVRGVSFNGRSVAGFGTPAPGFLEVTVPSGASTGPIRVTNAVGVGVSAASFVVTSAPIIEEVSPLLAAPGAAVVINGANFTGTTAVRFNGVAASFAVTANTQLHTTVPAGATTGPLVIQNASGSATSTVPFTVIGSAPVVTDFTPNYGPRGTPVVIEGLNFINVTAVTFNGTNAEHFVATAPTQIHAVAPAGVTTGPIRVTTTSGTYASTNRWFHGPPRLTGFSPAVATVGDEIELTGTNLAPVVALRVGGVPWPAQAADGRTLRATVPAEALDGSVALTTPGGSFLTTNQFRLLPTVSDVTPTLGQPGSQVTLRGHGFASATAVLFAGTPAAFQVIGPTEIQATVPAGARTGPVEVQNPAGSAFSSQTFTVSGPSDLAVTVAAVPEVARPGASIMFHVTLTNRGPALRSLVVLTNVLPTGLTFVSASASRGTVLTSGGTSVLRLATLEAGAAVGLDIQAAAPAEGRHTNHAWVIAAEPDLAQPNNAASSVVAILTEAAQRLRIRSLLATEQVVVSWPTSALPFVLQVTTNLGLPAGWTTAGGAPQVTAGEWRVTNAASGFERFYRLRY